MLLAPHAHLASISRVVVPLIRFPGGYISESLFHQYSTHDEGSCNSPSTGAVRGYPHRCVEKNSIGFVTIFSRFPAQIIVKSIN